MFTSGAVLSKSTGDVDLEFSHDCYLERGKKKRHCPDAQRDVVISRALLDDDLRPDRSPAPVLTTRTEPERRRDDLLVLALGRHLPLPRDGVSGPESVARRGAAPYD